MAGFTNAGREALSTEFQGGDHGAGYASPGRHRPPAAGIATVDMTTGEMETASASNNLC